MTSVEIHKVIRSKRRSIALVMTPEAMLVVRAPMLTPLKYIESVVEKQKLWIERKRAQILKRGVLKPKQFKDGEEFLFLGQPYRFTVCSGLEIEIKDDKLLFPEKQLKKAKQKLIQWYKEESFALITEIAQKYSRVSGWKYKTININSAKTRWGSCSSSGSINFSYKLMLAPRAVVEYVVVHELSHITEKNHSPRFWAKVQSLMPDYRLHEKWLKENGRNLTI